jgi:hypothetical protein
MIRGFVGFPGFATRLGVLENRCFRENHLSRARSASTETPGNPETPSAGGLCSRSRRLLPWVVGTPTRARHVLWRTAMSKGPGRVERAIRELLDAPPFPWTPALIEIANTRNPATR